MSTLIFDLDGINDRALAVTKAIVDRNEQTHKIENREAGPLAVAAALSDFFEIATAIDQGAAAMDGDELTDFAAYGLDLFDRLAYQLLVLEVMQHRNDMALIYASMAVWFARRDVVFDNLEGIADGFGRLTNGLQDPGELAEMCALMGEVTDAASDQVRTDADQSNPYRPWRVLNLNAGIAATRSLNPELMQQTFDKLARHLPNDMPGFLADGRRQMAVQDVPDAVREVIDRYAKKWPSALPH